MTLVPEFRWVRHCRQNFARVPRRKVLGQTWPTIAQCGTSADAAAVRGAICGPVCLPVPRTTGVGSFLLPVRDATASLAHEVHATVLRDHDRHRSGQRSAQTVGRAVARAHVPCSLFGDLLAFEVQRPPHALYVRDFAFCEFLDFACRAFPEVHRCMERALLSLS